MLIKIESLTNNRLIESEVKREKLKLHAQEAQRKLELEKRQQLCKKLQLVQKH